MSDADTVQKRVHIFCTLFVVLPHVNCHPYNAIYSQKHNTHHVPSSHTPAMDPDPRSELLKMLFTSDSEDCEEPCAATPPIQGLAATVERRG